MKKFLTLLKNPYLINLFLSIDVLLNDKNMTNLLKNTLNKKGIKIKVVDLWVVMRLIRINLYEFSLNLTNPSAPQGYLKDSSIHHS